MVFACKSGPGVRPEDDRYPFCSGDRLDRERLNSATTAAYDAGAKLTTALCFDGVSDRARDDALEAAELNLRDALFHVQALRQPEPPKVAPSMFATACDIATAGAPDLIGMARVFGARL